MIDAVSVVGDQLEFISGLAQYGRIDAVGHRGHQHIGVLYGVGELRRGHGLVIEVELGVEQLAHARLDAVRKLAGDDDQRSFAVRHGFSTFAISLPRE
jgi:hypothetical protein